MRDIRRLGRDLAPTSVQPSREEELDLLHRAKAGDKAAASRLVESVGLMILGLAIKHHPDEHEQLDSFQAGVMGAYRAIEKYDFSFDCRYCTYAQWWVRNGMQQNAKIAIRARRHRVEDEAAIYATVPDPAEIVAEKDAEVQWKEYVSKLHDRIDSLPPRKADLIYARLDRDESTKQAAARYGVSRERIRQVLAEGYEEIAVKLRPCPIELLPQNWDSACYAATVG